MVSVWLAILISVVSVFAVVASQSPCTGYRTLDPWESFATIHAISSKNDILLCDDFRDEDTWYRFAIKSEMLSPTTYTPPNRCRTTSPIVLRRSAATSVRSQRDNVTVGTTTDNIDVSTQKCAPEATLNNTGCPAISPDTRSFYLYKLKRVAGCSAAVCVGRTVPDHRGKVWHGDSCIDSWYRFTSGRIPEMWPPTTHVPSNRCGIISPLIVRRSTKTTIDAYPTQDHESVEETACIIDESTLKCAWELVTNTTRCPSDSAGTPSFNVHNWKFVEGCTTFHCVGTDSVPTMFDAPELQGPITVTVPWTSGNTSGTYDTFQFRCVVRYLGHEATARFRVRFLFDDEDMSSPPPINGSLRLDSAITTVANLTVVLNEEQLRGRLGKHISCSVVPYWDGNDDAVHQGQLQEWKSRNSYWAGIKSVGAELELDQSRSSIGTLHFKSTVPITHAHCYKCPNLTCNPKYQFSVKKTHMTHDSVTCSILLRDSTVAGSLTVVSTPGIIRTTAREYQLEFKPYENDYAWSKTCKGAPLSIWRGYTIPAVKVRIVRSTPSIQVCASFNDPTIITFGSSRWHSVNELGDFYLVVTPRTETTMHLEIQARHQACHLGTCNCGVIVREGNSIIGVDCCGSNRTPRIVRYLEQIPSDGSSINVDTSGTSYTISMPSGVRVDARFERRTQPFIQLKVFLPEVYHNRLDGLCVNASGNYRVPHKASFFHNNGKALSCVDVRNSEPLSCDCQRSSDGRPTTLNCSRLSLDPTAASIPVAPKRTGRVCKFAAPASTRSRRSLTPTTVDTSDVDDSIINDDELFSDLELSAVEDGARPNEPPIVKSNISDEQALKHCSDTLRTSRAYATCRTTIDETLFIEDCKHNVMITRDSDIANLYVTQMENMCLVTNVIESNMSDDATSLPPDLTNLVQNICAGHCKHGSCVNGKCVCENDYVGDDCDTRKDTPPVVVGLVHDGLCDVSIHPCLKTNVFVERVVHSPTLFCRFSDPAQTEHRTSQDLQDNWMTYNTEASIISFAELTCPLPPRSIQRPAFVHLTLAVSLDGVHFSQSRDLTVFDSVCMRCDVTSAQCAIRDDTCLIDNRCYNNGDRNESTTCRHCDPIRNAHTWSGVSCGNGADTLTSAVMSTVVHAIFVILCLLR